MQLLNHEKKLIHQENEATVEQIKAFKNSPKNNAFIGALNFCSITYETLMQHRWVTFSSVYLKIRRSWLPAHMTAVEQQRFVIKFL